MMRYQARCAGHGRLEAGQPGVKVGPRPGAIGQEGTIGSVFITVDGDGCLAGSQCFAQQIRGTRDGSMRGRSSHYARKGSMRPRSLERWQPPVLRQTNALHLHRAPQTGNRHGLCRSSGVGHVEEECGPRGPRRPCTPLRREGIRRDPAGIQSPDPGWAPDARRAHRTRVVGKLEVAVGIHELRHQ